MKLYPSLIRDVADFPKEGILFKDLTPLFLNPKAFSEMISEMAEYCKDLEIDAIAAIESRGFIIAAPLAIKLNVGMIPIRKPGKLPYAFLSKKYSLEYNDTSELQIHTDAVKKGEKILLVDDVLATGGTAAAASELIQELGGNIVSAIFLLELTFLEGRKKVEHFAKVHSLVKS